MALYGGEIFGNNNPSPYQVARDFMSFDMQNKRLQQQEARIQRAQDAKVGNTIRSTFDKAHYTTGTGADPVINEMLTNLIDEFSGMYRDSKGALDSTDMMVAMQGKMMGIKAYYDNVNVIKKNAIASSEALSKQYPGFNKQELYQKAMDKGLYKDGIVIRNAEELDLQTDFVNEVIDKDYGSLNIGPRGMYDDISKAPLTTQMTDIVTRDKSGYDTRYRGRAVFNQNYQEVTYDPETGKPKIGLKTITVLGPDGTEYKDKATGEVVKTIDEDKYQEFIQNRQRGARMYQLADNKYKELSEKGIQLDESDREIFRRQAATNEVDGQFRNRTDFLDSKKWSLNKNHGYKIGRPSEMLPFDLEAAPKDTMNNRNLTGQVGNFTVYDPQARSGSSPAEVWLTPRGGLIIKVYEQDMNGNRTGKIKREDVYYGEDAKRYVQGNSGWSGNNKKDLFKMLDLFDGRPDDDTKSDIIMMPGGNLGKVAGEDARARKESSAPVKQKAKTKGKYD